MRKATGMQSDSKRNRERERERETEREGESIFFTLRAGASTRVVMPQILGQAAGPRKRRGTAEGPTAAEGGAHQRRPRLLAARGAAAPRSLARSRSPRAWAASRPRARASSADAKPCARRTPS
eukprot:2689668-Pyramimonas_sp.AAC.1